MIGVNQNQIVIFTNQLAAMLRSRLPLVQALSSLSADSPDRTIKRALVDIVARVSNGEEFSNALKHHPRVFGPEFVSIAHSGMESGYLADAISRAAIYLERVHVIQSKLRGALVYPAFLLAGFVAIFHVLIFFVLPRFDQIFSQFDKDLPQATRVLVAVGDFYTQNWPSVSVLLLCTVLFFMFVLSLRSGRRAWDRIKLQIPVVGPIMYFSAMARFAHTMSLQLESSVSLVNALRTAAPVTKNSYYRELVQKAADDIELGLSVAQSLGHRGLFTGAIYQMAVAGEQTGRLDEMFRSLAAYFDNLWLQKMEGVAGIINPALTAFVGATIAGMIVAAFLPVFNISGLTLG